MFRCYFQYALAGRQTITTAKQLQGGVEHILKGFKKKKKQKYKRLCCVRIKWLALILSWNAEIFDKSSIPEWFCLHSRCLFINVPFLSCIAGIFDICSMQKLVALSLHLKASSPLRGFLRKSNLSPHTEVFWLEYKWSEMISAERVSFRGRLLHLLHRVLNFFCDSRSLSLFIQLPCARAYRLCILLPN